MNDIQGQTILHNLPDYWKESQSELRTRSFKNKNTAQFTSHGRMQQERYVEVLNYDLL